MKREWGTKRTCPSCGARFYDLGRKPISCPKCHATYSPEDFLKNRRARPVPARKSAPAPAVAKVPLKAQATEPEAELEMGDVEPRKEDKTVEPPKGKGTVAAGELIEDAAELGEDEDDMAEVMDNVEEKGDR